MREAGKADSFWAIDEVFGSRTVAPSVQTGSRGRGRPAWIYVVRAGAQRFSCRNTSYARQKLGTVYMLGLAVSYSGLGNRIIGGASV